MSKSAKNISDKKFNSKNAIKKTYKKVVFDPKRRARDWRFTINNYSDDDIANLMSMCEDDSPDKNVNIVYMIGGFEFGEKNKTPHIQGYLELKNAVTWGSIIRWNDISGCTHWDIEPKSKYATADDNINYCTGNSTGKTKNEDYFEYGTPKQQGKRNDWHGAKDILKNGGSLDDVAENDFKTYVRYERGLTKYKQIIDKHKSKELRHKLHVTVLWGDAGAGKTRFVYDNHDINDIYRLRSSNGGNIWFNNYDGEPILLIDDFRGWIRFTDLLELLDIFPCPIEFKGGSTYARWTKVFITSNKHPKNWYPGIGFPYELERRLHVIIHMETAGLDPSKKAKEDEHLDAVFDDDYGILYNDTKKSD